MSIAAKNLTDKSQFSEMLADQISKDYWYRNRKMNEKKYVSWNPGMTARNTPKDAVTAMSTGRMKHTAVRFHQNNAAKHRVSICRLKRNVTER